MNELQSMVLREKHVHFSGKSNHFRFSATPVHIVCEAMTYTRNVNFDKFFSQGFFLTDSMMAEVERVVLKKKIKSARRDIHTKMHFLTKSANQISVPRIQTQNLATE